jgi:hypothetical protein
LVVSLIRHRSDYPQELVVQQSENFGSFVLGPTKPRALIVEGIARCAAVQRSGGAVIEGRKGQYFGP